MGVVGTVGRYRSRQAFMNTGSKLMMEIFTFNNIYNRFLLNFFFSVTKSTSGSRRCLNEENKSI